MKTDTPPASQASAFQTVSMVKNAASTACKDASPEGILKCIRDGRWEDEVTHIVDTYNKALTETNTATQAKKAISKLKCNLPGILWSGRFSERKASAIEKYSGLLVMDLDDLTDAAIRTAREQLQADQFVWACFLSPSGTGLKVLFRTPKDPQSHKAAWQAAANHIKKLTRLDADSSGKDLARLCFVSFDPNLYRNPTASELPVTVDASPMAYSGVQPSLDNATLQLRRNSAEELLGSVDWVDDYKGYVTCPGEDSHTNRNGHRDCLIHIDGAPNIHCVHQSCSALCQSKSTELQRKIGWAESGKHSQDSSPMSLVAGSKLPDQLSKEWFILPGDDSCSITESARNIFAVIAATKTLFQRGGQVVELEQQQDGTYFLEIITPSTFRSRIENYGRTVGAYRTTKNGERILRQVPCPEEKAKALLHSKQAKLLPPVSQVLNSPAIVESGDQLKLLTKGYNPENGGILVSTGDLPDAPPLAEAIQSLKNLLEDFDFQTPSDRSRAIAAFITPALRIGGFIKSHVVIDIAEADLSQAGKGYRQKVVAAIYNEEPRMISQRKGGVGSLDESLSQALIQGSLFIQFDNLSGKVQSQTLEAFVTCGGMFPARVPHRGEVLVDSTKFLLQITSNKIETTKDLANRASICRIRKHPEGYQFKGYPEGDLLTHVRANQPYYLGCVFEVIKEWHSQGKPKVQECHHDFREWAMTLDWIVQELFDAAPLLDGHRTAQERASNPALNWLRSVALAVKAENQQDEELTASTIVELCQNHGLDIPGLKNLTDDDQAKMRVGTVMSNLFRNTNPIKVEEFEVTRSSKTEYSESQRRELTVKTYHFAYRAYRAYRSSKDSENCGADFREVKSAVRTVRKAQNQAMVKQQDVEYV
ncbi:hypothetical protein OAA59_01480 [bacterium]|nr:hypothetical protein [bacterium]